MKGGGRLLQTLPRSGFGLGQRLLAFQLLARLDLLCGGGSLLGLGLGDGRVLQLDLVGEIVERSLRAQDASLGLRHLGLIIGGIDLDQEIAGPDVLEIVQRNAEHLTGDPAAEPGQIGADIGVIGGLDNRASNPGIPAQRRHRNKSEHITAKSGIASRARALRRLIGAAVRAPDDGGTAVGLGWAAGTAEMLWSC